MPQDPDRSRGAVYQAEESVAAVMRRRNRAVRIAGSTLRLPEELRFGSVGHVQAYVDAVLAASAREADFPDRGPVVVAVRLGFRRATYHEGTISIPAADPRGRWALTRGVVLHELAHHFADGHGHGAAFRATLVELYRRHVGPDAATLLSHLLAPIEAVPEPAARSADDDRVRRVAALLAKAERAANAAEAEAYLAKASLVAQRHSVDMALAAVTAQGCSQVPTHRMLTIGEPRRQLNKLLTSLLVTIARAWEVRADIGPGSTYVIIFGMPADLDRVEAVFATASTVMVDRAREHVRSGQWRGTTYLPTASRSPRPVTAAVARNAFLLGFITRLGQRLAAASRQARRSAAEATAQGATTTATVGVDVALRARELAITEYYRSASQARGTWRGSVSAAGSATTSRRAGERAAEAFQRPSVAGRRRAIGS